MSRIKENIGLFEGSVLKREMSVLEKFIFENGYSYALIDMSPSNMLSSKQVAEMIGVDQTNMTHKKKTKGFPQPFHVVDKFPLYLKSDIEAWMEAKGYAQT